MFEGKAKTKKLQVQTDQHSTLIAQLNPPQITRSFTHLIDVAVIAEY